MSDHQIMGIALFSWAFSRRLPNKQWSSSSFAYTREVRLFSCNIIHWYSPFALLLQLNPRNQLPLMVFLYRWRGMLLFFCPFPGCKNRNCFWSIYLCILIILPRYPSSWLIRRSSIHMPFFAMESESIFRSVNNNATV